MAEAVTLRPEEVSPERRRRARLFRRCGITLLAVFVGLGVANFFGSKTGTVSAEAEGYHVTVDYPAHTRSSLPIEWKVTITHVGGFSSPVRLAMNESYFNWLDFNNTYPLPVSTKTIGNRFVWTFPPPTGDSLIVLLDARMQPGRGGWDKGTLALLSDVGTPVVDLSYTTLVIP